MSVTLDGVKIKVQVREAGTSTWKRMTCELDSTEEMTNDVNEVTSKCGNHVTVQPIKENVSGNAVCNADPGVNEVSWNDVRDWQRGRDLLEMLIENEAFTAEDGTSYAEAEVLHHFYVGKFVQSSGSGGVTGPAQFSWAFKPTTESDDSGAS